MQLSLSHDAQSSTFMPDAVYVRHSLQAQSYVKILAQTKKQIK